MGLKDTCDDLQKNDLFLEIKLVDETFELSWIHSLKQILAACIAHSLAIQAGINISFSAILLPQLKEENSEIRINLNQASWIASIVTVSLPFGSVFIGILMDKFGRKKMCLFTIVPFFVSWILHSVAVDIWYIYIARAMAGFGSGISTVVLVYVSEIAHPRYRSMLLTFNSVFVTFGILLTFVLGFGFHWTTITKIYAALNVVSGICLTFIPESPYWLLVFKNDRKECAKSLRWIYTDEKVYEQEYQKILDSSKNCQNRRAQFKSSQYKEILQFYKNSVVWKPLVILLTLFLFQQLSAGYVIIFYAIDIFRKISESFKHIGLIDEFIALILLGGIRFVISIFLAAISKKIGRRILMCISSGGMVISSLSLGIYMYIAHQSTIIYEINSNLIISRTELDKKSESNGTVAISLLLCYVFFSSFGWLVIPWTLIGELLPIRVKGIVGGLMVALTYIFMFLMVKLAPSILENVALESIFFSLSTVNVFGLVFLYFLLPETLGKSFQDISRYFEKDVEI